MISSLQSHFEDLCPDEKCVHLLYVVRRECSPVPACSSDVRVLVPGAGLGRLAWEIIQSGTSFAVPRSSTTD